MRIVTSLGLAVLLTLPLLACSRSKASIPVLATMPLEFAKQPAPVASPWTLPTVNRPAIAFTPDNRLLALRDGNQIQIWDLQTRQLQQTLTDSDPAPDQIVLTPDGNTLISAQHQTLNLWDLRSGQRTHTLTATAPINHFSLSPDGRILAIASSSIELWNLTTRQRLSESGTPGCARAHSVTFLANGEAIAYVTTPTEPRISRTGSPPDCQPVPDLTSDTIEIRTLKTGQITQRIPVQSYIRSLVVQGQTLVAALTECQGGDCYTGGENAIKVWNLQTGNLIQTLASGTISPSLALSSDGQTLASTSLDGTLSYWNLQTGELQNSQAGLAPAGWGFRVVFSPSNQLATLQDNAVTLR